MYTDLVECKRHIESIYLKQFHTFLLSIMVMPVKTEISQSKKCCTCSMLSSLWFKSTSYLMINNLLTFLTRKVSWTLTLWEVPQILGRIQRYALLLLQKHVICNLATLDWLMFLLLACRFVLGFSISNCPSPQTLPHRYFQLQVLCIACGYLKSLFPDEEFL